MLVQDVRDDHIKMCYHSLPSTEPQIQTQLVLNRPQSDNQLVSEEVVDDRGVSMG